MDNLGPALGGWQCSQGKDMGTDHRQLRGLQVPIRRCDLQCQGFVKGIICSSTHQSKEAYREGCNFSRALSDGWEGSTGKRTKPRRLLWVTSERDKKETRKKEQLEGVFIFIFSSLGFPIPTLSRFPLFSSQIQLIYSETLFCR